MFFNCFFVYLQLSPSKVYNHFADEFIDIRMASFIPGYAFIMFVYEDDYEQVLASQNIEIEGVTIPAKRADYSNLPYKMYERLQEAFPMNHQVNRVLLQPEDEASPKNIVLLLNEDCLHEIFVRVSLVDLYCVAKTCRRFNEIAKTVFDRKYKTIELTGLPMMIQIRDFLNNFGPSITSFNLYSYRDREEISFNEVVGLLDKNCKNIVSLRLHGELMENFVIENHIEMFGRLKKLYVCIGFLPLNRLLAACPQLESLTITSYKDPYNVALEGVSLPQLITLRLYITNCDGIEAFLMRHPLIENFDFRSIMIFTEGQHYRTNHLIYECLPNIRTVTFFHLDSNEEHRLFNGKKNLRSVEMFSSHGECTPIINEFLKQNTPIEELTLYSDEAIDNNTMKAICKLQTIKKIDFSYYNNTEKLIKVVETLPNLKEINTCAVDKAAIFLEKVLPILQHKGIKWSDDSEFMNDSSSASYVSVAVCVYFSTKTFFIIYFKDPKNGVVFIDNANIAN